MTLRVPLASAYLKRTCHPTYAFTQSTPIHGVLDDAWDRSVNIWPGMAAMKLAGDEYTLVDGTGRPAGLFAHYIGGDGIDEIKDQGVSALAVWVMGPDAEFEILDPAFDSSLTWTEATDGTETLVHCWVTGAGRGKLAPAGATKAGHTLSTDPVARLQKVVSAKKIVIRGLPGRS